MKVLRYILGLIVLLLIAFFTLGFLNPEISYETRTEIQASVEETFAVFNDPERMGEWLVGFHSMENISGNDNEVGSKWKLRFEENGEVMEVNFVLLKGESGAVPTMNSANVTRSCKDNSGGGPLHFPAGAMTVQVLPKSTDEHRG